MKPWESEPDELDFEAHGFKCAMRRGPAGHWCGYVGLPAGHSAFGKHYDEVQADVHGGLTWSEDRRGGDKRADDGGLWWLGFDCAHSGDYCPDLTWQADGDVYRDVAYVRAECKSLARQLSSAAAE